MANILLDANNWQDSLYGEPPSYWNGTAYDYIGDVSSGLYYQGCTMQYMGIVNAGDIIAFTISSTSPDATEFGVTVNGSSIYAKSLTNGSSFTFASQPLSAGDSVIVTLGVGDNLYSQDAVLTPTPNPAPPAPKPCIELGRATRCYVSGYTRDRVHDVKLMAQEKRCLIANFNGALPAARTIASVVWSVSKPAFVNLSQCDITGRETACIINAQWRGSSLVRCAATMDNGEVYTQYFAVSVKGYWFQGDVPGVQGPYQISAP